MAFFWGLRGQKYNKMITHYLRPMLAIILILLNCAMAKAFDFEVDGMRYTVITSSSAELTGIAPNLEGEVVIPEFVTFNGKQLSVNTIGQRAFFSYKSSFLRIPKHITRIKDYAFSCAKIDSLHFDESEVAIRLENTINRQPSMSGSELGSVYIGRQLNRTDYNSNADGPFYGSSVRKIYIGQTVSLGEELFQNCRKLEEVVVKEGTYIRSISEKCFQNCSNLKSVELKKGLKSIASLAFEGCLSLDSIYIPSTVTSIESNAFSEAKSISKVVAASNDPSSISSDAFPGIVYFSSILYVPVGIKSKYETTNGWKEFTNIVETIELESEYSYYNLNLSVTSGGNVSIFNKSYSNDSFTTAVKEGEDISFSFSADEGYQLKSLIVNGRDETEKIYNNTYQISSVNENLSIEVTFKELPLSLLIKSADNGTITQLVERGKVYSFVINPCNGWGIESVSFNGENVTEQLKENKYTTPSIIEDSELNIVYKQLNLTNVTNRRDNNVRVYASNGILKIENNGKRANLSVYSTSGGQIMVDSIEIGTSTFNLPTNAIYLIKVGENVFKVLM